MTTLEQVFAQLRHSMVVDNAHTFERSVAQRLHERTADYNFGVYTNLIVPHDGKTSEVDALLLLPNCLVVIECKDYGAAVFESETNPTNWVIMYPNGINYRLYNPVRQNATHIRALCVELGLHPSQCLSLVVFSDRTTLKSVPPNTPHTIVCNYADLDKIDFGNFPGERFSPAKCMEIAVRCAWLATPEEERIKQHNAYLREFYEGTVCPLCGHTLVERQRKRDGHKFYGCSMYPVCTFVRDIN